jgi:hypothetical protein
MRPFTQRESRLLAIGVLVLAVAAAWLGVISPVAGGFRERARERQQLLASYERNQRLLSGVPLWRAQAEMQRRTLADYAILAPSQAFASDLLKKRIAQIAGDEGAVLKSAEDVQADVPPGWVRIRADLQLTMSQLVSSLRRLDTEDNYVVIEYLSVAADRALQTGKLAPMDVRIELAAPYQAARAR